MDREPGIDPTGECRYRLSSAAPEYLHLFICDTARWQAAYQQMFDLSPVGVSVRVVNDFIAEVNASAARSATPPRTSFHAERAGDSLVVAKTLAIAADASRCEIL